jgi:hypothetical protein
MAPNAGKGRRSRRGGKRRIRWWIYAAGAAVGVAALAFFLTLAGLTGGDPEEVSPVVVPSPKPAGLAQEGRLLGSASAPVSIVEYADFQ